MIKILLLVASLFLMGAGPSSPANCYWEGTSIIASGLTPGEIRLGVGDPRPNGSIYYSYDGTLIIPNLSLSSGYYYTAYISERGGGKSLIKLGKQWNDYHIVAICTTFIP